MVRGCLFHGYQRPRNQKPGPPPFSSMNSTLANSKARRPASSAAVMDDGQFDIRISPETHRTAIGLHAHGVLNPH
jgi:hypothetical protein